jgi:hypothetical protein
MSERKIDFDTVRRIALSLPGVEESTAYGSPALKVKGQLLACIPTHRSAEPDSVVVRIDFADRDELLAAAPEVYYLKDHYVNYPAILARLPKIHPDALRDLIGMSWRFVTSRKLVKKRPARRRQQPG